jgi:NAD(P)-dependent dehydrogenase (short-subunit alcohol dehydrogenase family)
MSQSHIPVALIAGASRGLGLGLVSEYLSRGWQVIATERQPGASPGLSALGATFGSALRIEALDINDEAQIRALAKGIEGVSLDLLFVIAGVSDDPSQTVGEISTAEFEHVFRTNVLGPMRALEWMGDSVRPDGVIAAMSSALGSLTMDPADGYEVYGASKAALNKLLRHYAARAGAKRTVLAIMPGWVRTDMGGEAAPLEVAASTAGIADAIQSRSGTPGAAFINYQNADLPW